MCRTRPGPTSSPPRPARPSTSALRACCALLLLVVLGKPIQPPWRPFGYNGRYNNDGHGSPAHVGRRTAGRAVVQRRQRTARGSSGSTRSCSCSTSSWSASRWTAAGCSSASCGRASAIARRRCTAIFAGFVVMFVVLASAPSWLNEVIAALPLACSSTSSCKQPVDDPGDRRRGVAVRLRLLAGLHQPGARRAAAAPRVAPPELVAALAAAAGREEDAARAGAARGRGAPHGRAAGQDSAPGHATR